MPRKKVRNGRKKDNPQEGRSLELRREGGTHYSEFFFSSFFLRFVGGQINTVGDYVRKNRVRVGL